MKPSVLLRSLSLVVAGGMAADAGADIADRPEVRSFVQQMVRKHRFDASELTRQFRQVDIQDKILDAMDKPYEAKPWYAYRKLFLTEARIQGGLSFWDNNRAALGDASAKYGVAPEVIVAIIGIETSYGQNTGNYRVIDALSTLAFAYPKRADFFRGELENYLVLCREEGIDAGFPKGSYAGAMGLPQFMPSSYRAFAVDLDGDHKRNIWTNPADAIGSVANYFTKNGWQRGGAVAYPASVDGDGFRQLLGRDLKPSHAVADLRRSGVRSDAALAASTRAKLLELDGDSGPEYWLTLQNFYAITRYNHSPLYAMAAHQLSQALVDRRRAQAVR